MNYLITLTSPQYSYCILIKNAYEQPFTQSFLESYFKDTIFCNFIVSIKLVEYSYVFLPESFLFIVDFKEPIAFIQDQYETIYDYHDSHYFQVLSNFILTELL